MSKSLRHKQRINRRVSTILMLTALTTLVLIGLAGLGRAPGAIFETSALGLSPASLLR